MQTIEACDLANVVGGEMIGGVEQGSDGRSNFRMDSIPKGTPVFENSPPPNPARQGVERYNKFYDNYTGLINNLNGLGGGLAVARGGNPTASGF
jgi:hypothetical protein